MHIAFLLHKRISGRGGTETALINMLNELGCNGVECTLVYMQPVYDDFLTKLVNVNLLKIEDLEEKEFSKMIPKFLKRILWKRRIKGYLRKVIHQNIRLLNIDALVVLDLPSKNIKYFFKTIIEELQNRKFKIFSWLHSSTHGLDESEKELYHKIFAQYDGHLAISSGIKIELEQELKLHNVHVIYNPIPLVATIKREYNHVVYMGRIDCNKRVENIIEMFNGIPGDWRFDIYGASLISEVNNSLIGKIESLGLQENIVFHGWVDEPWTRIESAGLLILNSRKEGFPYVLLEAMVRGVPCLSTDCPTGPNEIIIPALNGYLYPVESEDEGALLLKNIVTGKIDFPDPSEIQESVADFTNPVIVDKFLKAIDCR